MNYRILMTVTVRQDIVEQRLKELDLTKLILVNNYTNPQILSLCQQAAKSGAEVYHFPYNLGCGASANLGMRKMMDEGDDIVIIASSSAKILSPVQEFVNYIEEAEKVEQRDRYICSQSTAGSHFFAFTRRAVELAGYYDENFWPIYFEDTEYNYRTSLISGYKVLDCKLGHIVKSEGISISMSEQPLLNLFQSNSNRIARYYQSKWGGNTGSERYTVPFNDPTKDIKEWGRWEPFYNSLIGQYSWYPFDSYPYLSRRI
jgi:GT2 family glycosyltransferase